MQIKRLFDLMEPDADEGRADWTGAAPVGAAAGFRFEDDDKALDIVFNVISPPKQDSVAAAMRPGDNAATP
jgi:hypothetical protein